MKYSIILLFFSFNCLADDETKIEAPKTFILEKVTVLGYNFCKVSTLNKFLPNRSGSVVLRTSSDCFPDDSACNPNYEVANLGAAFIQKTAKSNTWDLGISGATCIQNCKGSDYQTGKIRLESDTKPYRAHYEINIDEVYDADGKQVEITCLQENCEGVFIHAEKGPYFLTDTTDKNGKVERRFIVNTKFGSKFVDKKVDNNFESCTD